MPADAANGTVMVMAGLRGRLASIVRIGAANLSRHGDRGAGFSIGKRDAPIRGEDKSHGLQEKQARNDARQERARDSLRLRQWVRHSSILTLREPHVNRNSWSWKENSRYTSRHVGLDM